MPCQFCLKALRAVYIIIDSKLGITDLGQCLQCAMSTKQEFLLNGF